MKIPKRFFLISGIILWISPFILACITKYINLKYTIILIILGVLFFIRYAFEKYKEENKKQEEEI